MIVLSDYLKERIQYVAAYIGTASDSWPVIKKHIVISMPGQRRKGLGFSRRHRFTKKMTLNEFDKAVMLYWSELTGVYPKIPETLLHDEGWVRRPKGWALNGGKEKWLLSQQGQVATTHRTT